MKMLMSLLVLTLSLNAFAAEVLSDDASDIASILLNKQLSACVSEYQKLGAHIIEISKDSVGKTELIKITSMTLLGGDIPKETVVMNIRKNYVPAPMGFGQVPVYKCELEVSSYR